MIVRLAGVFGSLAFLLMVWQECGENVPLFCYRIGLGALFSVRSRAMAALPVAHSTWRDLRNSAACSKRFGIFSTRSTTFRD